ncbi:hypothetical protein Plhal304r1_c005g0020251 [Plasmopara halstedii]
MTNADIFDLTPSTMETVHQNFSAKRGFPSNTITIGNHVGELLCRGTAWLYTHRLYIAHTAVK